MSTSNFKDSKNLNLQSDELSKSVPIKLETDPIPAVDAVSKFIPSHLTDDSSDTINYSKILQRKIKRDKKRTENDIKDLEILLKHQQNTKNLNASYESYDKTRVEKDRIKNYLNMENLNDEASDKTASVQAEGELAEDHVDGELVEEHKSGIVTDKNDINLLQNLSSSHFESKSIAGSAKSANFQIVLDNENTLEDVQKIHEDGNSKFRFIFSDPFINPVNIRCSSLSLSGNIKMTQGDLTRKKILEIIERVQTKMTQPKSISDTSFIKDISSFTKDYQNFLAANNGKYKFVFDDIPRDLIPKLFNVVCTFQKLRDLDHSNFIYNFSAY